MIEITKDYLLNLIKNNKRTDNRKLDEFRDIQIEIGISKNAEGSARVKLGETEVIAGIKLDLAEPYPDSPDEGVLKTTAEFLAIASPKFEGGLPGADAVELARVVDRGIRHAGAIDTKKLCIKEGEKVWIVYVDVIVINHDGNLTDASSIAAIAALLNTKMPKLEKDEETINREELKNPLPMRDIPIAITIRKMNSNLLVDTNALEEDAIEERVTVITKKDKNVCGMQQGSGSFTQDEILKIVDLSQKLGEKIRKKHFDKFLK